MNMNNYLQTIPDLQPYFVGADHVDVKTIEGTVTMRQFIANMFSYMPGWMRGLYKVRAGFVRLLGMKQEEMPEAVHIAAADVPMVADDMMTFFQVVDAKEGVYWISGADESHLAAKLGVVVEPLAGELKRFHFITIVHYHNWTGRVYFNVIRPFHHVVARAMINAGIKGR